MWKTFTWVDDIFMIKIETVDDNLKVAVTDLNNIWIKCFTKEEVLQKFVECNPIIETTEEKVIDLILPFLNNLESSIVECIHTDEQFILNINCNASDIQIKYKYEFILNKTQENMFADQVIHPMIYTIKYLEDQNKQLSNLLTKKDREIEEYKLEHGTITRTDLVTEVFNPCTEELKNEKLVLNVFGQSKQFWNIFMKKCGASEIKLSDIKKDPWNDKKRKRKVYSKSTVKQKGIKFN